MQKAVVWTRNRRSNAIPIDPDRPSWLPEWVDIGESGFMPGQTLEHKTGEIYVLDPSSAFEASVFCQLQGVGSVLDMCAAPGGKSALVWAHLHPERFVVNEVIGKRQGMLRANMERCGIVAEVTCHDPSWFSENHPKEFDLVIVDAPCSGQALLAKGKKNPGCYHPLVIEKNAMRQRRILAHAAQCVAPGGFLAYMTCTFNVMENERNVEWLVKKFPEFAGCPVESLAEYESDSTVGATYRLATNENRWAGGFTALLHF